MTAGPIVVVSHGDDPHAVRVMEHLGASGHEALLLDLSTLPASATLTFDYGVGGQPEVAYAADGGSAHRLDRARAVWWRRPQAADLSSVADRAVHLFAANEWAEALAGLWLLVDTARWMNHPSRDEVASRKADQLRAAVVAGLAVPATLITSDPDRARAFIARFGLGRTVFKTFSCTHEVWRETRLVRSEELVLLDSVRLAPVIFQEYLAGVDVRVTVVGDRMFAAAIDAGSTDYPVDFRMSLGQADTAPVQLPTGVEAGLRALMSALGLVYGAVDFRRRPDGTYVFLEVNTAGEFLFVEERTGQPIAAALAAWLAG